MIEAGGISAIAAGMEASAPLSMRQMWTIRQHDGPDRLGLLSNQAHMSSKPFLEKATRALYFLGDGNAEGKEAIIQADVSPLLIRCMKEHKVRAIVD